MNVKNVQAYIANIVYPKSLDSLVDTLIDKGGTDPGWIFSIGIHHSYKEIVNWTAPRWILKDDIAKLKKRLKNSEL